MGPSSSRASASRHPERAERVEGSALTGGLQIPRLRAARSARDDKGMRARSPLDDGGVVLRTSLDEQVGRDVEEVAQRPDLLDGEPALASEELRDAGLSSH